jgi:hypothetical protein
MLLMPPNVLIDLFICIGILQNECRDCRMSFMYDQREVFPFLGSMHNLLNQIDDSATEDEKYLKIEIT